MDTIARENTSYLPVAGVIVGVLALVLAGVALAKVSSAKKDFDERISAQSTKLDEADSKAANALAVADGSKQSLNKLAGEIQAAFATVSTEIGGLRGDLTKVQEVTKPAPKAVAAGTKAAPGTPADKAANPTEKTSTTGRAETSANGFYVIRQNDTLAKIAKANGISLSKLQAANPSVDANKLKVGQKIKLPTKP